MSQTKFAKDQMLWVLQDNRTYYVRTDGSDSNTGLVDSAAGAFLTIQAAVNAASAIDSNTYDITIQVRDGTYVSGQILCLNLIGSGICTIQGNSGTPANVVIDGGFVKDTPGTSYVIKNLKMIKSSGTAIMAIKSVFGALINISNVEFGTGFSYQLYAGAKAFIYVLGNYKISGGAFSHMHSDGDGLISVMGYTITLTGTPAYTVFAYSSGLSMIYSYGNTYTGVATGKRFDVNMNSIIQTYGSGLTYLPGNSAGTIATGGQYA